MPLRLIDARNRGAHSEKPELFAAMIERLWPNTPKLEMFARRPRPGWDAWGNEVAALE
jgi:N6-adenosine-specific RNA methylase IME4